MFETSIANLTAYFTISWIWSASLWFGIQNCKKNNLLLAVGSFSNSINNCSTVESAIIDFIATAIFRSPSSAIRVLIISLLVGLSFGIPSSEL